MKRGSVYWLNLDPTIGAEIKKKRPCALVGADPINKARRIVVVVPLSTSARPRPPIVVEVSFRGKRVVAVLDQIRAVDKSRLLEKSGSISTDDLKRIDNGLKQVLCL